VRSGELAHEHRNSLAAIDLPRVTCLGTGQRRHDARAGLST
jgi:hypothetical protein